MRIISIFSYIISIVFCKRKCQHPNLIERKWFKDDKICMIRYYCPSCGFFSIGLM
jgi:hypothetical protein